MEIISGILIGGFAAYAITFVLTMSYIAQPFRDCVFKQRVKWNFQYPWETCRMCVGFWVSVMVWLLLLPVGGILMLFSIYGFSYFLACREIPVPPSDLDNHG